MFGFTAGTTPCAGSSATPSYHGQERWRAIVRLTGDGTDPETALVAEADITVDLVRWQHYCATTHTHSTMFL
jgi:hypothetical protein